MGRFFWVNLSFTNKTDEAKRILMEEGTRFENKGAVYTMNADGQLSVFDKELKTERIGDSITLTDYQYRTFKAVMNNDDDGKNVDALSQSDISKALSLSKKSKHLRKDLSEYLTDEYRVENPKGFPEENKFSAYITNGMRTRSAVLSFQCLENVASASVENNPVPKAEPKYEPVQERPARVQPGAFTGDGLFNHSGIKVHKSTTHRVGSNESLVDLAKKYEVDTYQLVAANPQLKAGRDYRITYPQNGLAQIHGTLPKGTHITIPARYSVKSGACSGLRDVASLTGVSEAFLRDFLTKIEVGNQDGIPDLVAYIDDGGTPTIGFGHTGKIDGRPLRCGRNKTRITRQKAYEILAEDILKHKAMVMAYLGEQNYKRAPKSVQDAILDVAYNKGIWDGFLTTNGYAASTRLIKNDLQQGHYASALLHTKREKTGFRGLRKRNIYRFISGLTDLSPEKRKSAIAAMRPYYHIVLNQCKDYDRSALQRAWSNAERGKTTGYTLK